MAIILAVETATTNCSVALMSNEAVLVEKSINEGYSHAEKLTLLIQEVLQQGGIKLQQVDAIAISKGPGSYTGLRIGTSTAKGICYGLNIPLIAVDTLLAMAYDYKQDTNTQPVDWIVPMLDARRMEVYHAICNSDLSSIKSPQPLILDENSFVEELKSGKFIAFIGDGAIKLQPLLNEFPNAYFRPQQIPQAGAIGKLAVQKFNLSQFENTAYFEPQYLKEFMPTQKKSKDE